MPAATPKALGYRMPAEWAPHQATWLSWPKDPITWPDRLPQAREAFAQMIEALTPVERVHLLVDSGAAEDEARKILAAKQIYLPHLVFERQVTADSWIRDYGPNFLVGPGGLAYNRWIFNAWGGKYESLKRDDGLPVRLAPYLNLPMFEPGIVMEGGSIEVNGEGLILTTEQCLLNPNRNPGLSRDQIEAILKDHLGGDKVLWLGEGVAGDDTDGHIDDIARFVAPDTVVTVVEEDPADENYRPLQDNLKRLQSMTDLRGRPLKILTLPMPGRIEAEGEPLPASYANFYIANEIVLVPVFGCAHDAKALSVLGKAFAGRRMVPIDCRDLVWGMGAIHCLTQQQPK